MKEDMFQNLHLQLSTDDIRRIDAWKIDNGMRSRAEAIRSMIKAASNAAGFRFAGGFNERDARFYTPDIRMPSKSSKQDNIEDVIRKVVREEIDKVKKDKR